MWLDKVRPWQVVLLAGLVRAVLICWAEYQDQHLPVKYTDIDYVVFTDAARFIAAGGSPYQRATYRYSPLLAYLLLPNIWLHPAWGKVLFSVSDLAAAGLLHFLLRRTGAPRPLRAAALLLWLFNPYTATISTRGSCDVLSVLLLLGLLVCLMYGMPLAAGALYGLAVHFRIYPVIYGPAIALYLMRRALALHVQKHGRRPPDKGDAHDAGGVAAGAVVDPAEPEQEPEPGTAAAAELEAETEAAGAPAGHATTGLRQRCKAYAVPSAAGGPGANGGDEREPRRRRRGLAPWLRPPSTAHGSGLSAAAAAAAAALRPAVLFGVAAAASFGLLGVCFYKMYGDEFLREAFLHHLTRKDPRHNFSPYYYPVYLSYGSTAGALSYGAEAAVGAPATAGLLQAGLRAVRRVVPLDEPWRLAMLPQAAALLALAVRFHEDLPVAWLLQTWCFVTLNKVVTAQYFVWYLSLLPLVLPALAAQRCVPLWALAVAGGAWVAAQLHWLAWAYQLEMRGRSVHLPLWAAGLVFQAANTVVLVLLARALLWSRRRRRDGGGGRSTTEGVGFSSGSAAAAADGDGDAGTADTSGASAGAAAGPAGVTFMEASLVLARPPPLSLVTPAGRKQL